MLLFGKEAYDKVIKENEIAQREYEEALKTYKGAQKEYKLSEQSYEDLHKVHKLANKLISKSTKAQEAARLASILSGPIPKDVFLKFNKKFNERMVNEVPAHPHDQAFHFFDKSRLLDLVNSNNSGKIAFLFTADPQGESLGIAVARRKDNGSFDPAHRYKSTRKRNVPTAPIQKPEDFDNAMLNYSARMNHSSVPFNPSCDRGIIHDREILEKWLSGVRSDKVVVYFGIDELFNTPPLQVVMLVDESLTDGDMVLNNANYAFDKGGGCCP